jgi:hypothetical protein
MDFCFLGWLVGLGALQIVPRAGLQLLKLGVIMALSLLVGTLPCKATPQRAVRLLTFGFPPPPSRCRRWQTWTTGHTSEVYESQEGGKQANTHTQYRKERALEKKANRTLKCFPSLLLQDLHLVCNEKRDNRTNCTAF